MAKKVKPADKLNPAQRSSDDRVKKRRNSHLFSSVNNPSKGRPKGALNKATTEAKAACNLIVDDPIYRRNLLAACRTRTVAPAVEQMLWYYAKGKPKERVEVGADKSLARLIAEAVAGDALNNEGSDDEPED